MLHFFCALNLLHAPAKWLLTPFCRNINSVTSSQVLPYVIEHVLDDILLERDTSTRKNLIKCTQDQCISGKPCISVLEPLITVYNARISLCVRVWCVCMWYVDEATAWGMCGACDEYAACGECEQCAACDTCEERLRVMRVNRGCVWIVCRTASYLSHI